MGIVAPPVVMGILAARLEHAPEGLTYVQMFEA